MLRPEPGSTLVLYLRRWCLSCLFLCFVGVFVRRWERDFGLSKVMKSFVVAQLSSKLITFKQVAVVVDIRDRLHRLRPGLIVIWVGSFVGSPVVEVASYEKMGSCGE